MNRMTAPRSKRHPTPLGVRGVLAMTSHSKYEYALCFDNDMKIYLIRHGETTSDLEDRYGGSYDDHLTERGRQQAQQLARELADSGIEKIFCSPLIRARETAGILSRMLHIEVEEVKNLRERNRYGALTGLTKADALGKFPSHVAALEPITNTIEGAEKWDDFNDRIIGAFYELAKKPFETIAILTHGGPLRVLTAKVLGVPHEKQARAMGDCGWALLDSADWRIEKSKEFVV